MLGISKAVHITSNNIVKKIQDYFASNNVDLKTLNISILGSDINDSKDFLVDEWIIKHSKKIHYDHSGSGFCEKTKKYIVYVYFDFSILNLDDIIHEVKHAYVDWCIFKNNGTPIKQTKEAKTLYTEDFSRLMSEEKSLFPNLYSIFTLYYYSTKLEIPSFLENHFLDSSYVDYKSIVLSMINFDSKNFKGKEYENEFEIIKSYDIPRFVEHESYNDFLEKSERFFKMRGFYILKKINKLEILKK